MKGPHAIWATVITDASYNDKNGSAGWAAWIRIDGAKDPIKHYSSFSVPVTSSSDAEKMAAINGIWIAKKHGANAFLIQTDCMAVVHLVKGVTKKRTPVAQWNSWISEAGLTGFPIIARHVKGHSKAKDARSYVNRWCDKMANNARRGTQCS
jgi:ribonuclease HI